MMCDIQQKVSQKLTKKAKEKHCCQLFPWIQSISNHLWWAAQSCKGDAQVFVENENPLYTTFLMYMNLFPKCVHQTLPPEEQHSKKWLKSGSVAHNALKKHSTTRYTAVGY